MSCTNNFKHFESKPISIVVPLYRSVEHLDGLAKLLIELTNNLHDDSEVIFINDGDPDQKDLCIYKDFEGLPVEFYIFHFKKNYGQMAATLFGISKAKCPIILTLDADAECKPSLLLELILLAESEEGKVGYIDFTIGDDSRSYFRQIMSSLHRGFVNMMVNKKLKGHVGSSIRVVHRSFVNTLVSKGLCPETLDMVLLRRAVDLEFVKSTRVKQNSSSYSTYKILELGFRSLLCLVVRPRPFAPTDYIYTD